MDARLWRTRAVSTSGRKRRRMFPCLLGVVITALIVAVTSCSSGTTTSTNAATANTTSTTSATTTTATGHIDLEADLGSPAQDVMNAVYTSVVNIRVSAGTGRQAVAGVGSGVVYTSDGLILTNDHVITLGGAVTTGQTITVTFSDGSQTPATIVGEDAARDIAAIKVTKTGLNPVVFGKSSEVQLAEWATVIGSPLDFRNSVTLGIVSGLDRTLQISATESVTGLVQIDTPISPGNSGGGCFDAVGRFIGMPEVYLPPGTTGAENIGFMIPADTVASVAKTLTGK